MHRVNLHEDGLTLWSVGAFMKISKFTQHDDGKEKKMVKLFCVTNKAANPQHVSKQFF